MTTFPKSEPIQLTHTAFGGNKQFLTSLSPFSVNVLFVDLTYLTDISSDGVRNGILPP